MLVAGLGFISSVSAQTMNITFTSAWDPISPTTTVTVLTQADTFPGYEVRIFYSAAGCATANVTEVETKMIHPVTSSTTTITDGTDYCHNTLSAGSHKYSCSGSTLTETYYSGSTDCTGANNATTHLTSACTQTVGDTEWWKVIVPCGVSGTFPVVAVIGTTDEDGTCTDGATTTLRKEIYPLNKCIAQNENVSSTAVYCVGDALVWSRWNNIAGCSGTPTVSMAIKKDICTEITYTGDGTGTRKMQLLGTCPCGMGACITDPVATTSSSSKTGAAAAILGLAFAAVL
jgi:hypothetical protein